MKIDELQKAIDEAAMAGVLMLRKSQMSFDFTAPNPHHVAYTRTNASGTVSNIAAKGAPKVEIKRVSSSEQNVSQRHVSYDLHVDGKYHTTHNDINDAMEHKERIEKQSSQPAAKETDWKGKKEKLGDATQAIIGRRTISAVSLHEINGTHEGATGALIQGGKKYDAVKHKGNWHLTGDYTQHEPAAKETKPNANVVHEHYPWGRLTKVEGKGVRAVLHPEHQEAVGKLQDGESTRFKDEQGIDWTAKHNGEHVELKAPARVSGTKLRVKHSDVAPSSAADIKKHPQYTDSDYNYLKGKGYSDEEVKNFWDRDHASGNAPLVHKKAPPVTEVIGDPDFYKKQALLDGVHKVGNDLLNNPAMAEHHGNIRNKLEGLKANPSAKAAAQVAGDLKLIAEKVKGAQQ